jgi:hypothetical protein
MDRLKVEDSRQKMFREDMEHAGFEVRVHFLHGARETYAVECRTRDARTVRDESGTPHVQDVYRATALRLDTDQCGHNVVLYPCF